MLIVLFYLRWFGDYRGLRFLCVHFGGRIFCFMEDFQNEKNISVSSYNIVGLFAI